MILNSEEKNFIMKPKNDYVFKRIFGDENNKDILIAFLEATLNLKIKDVEILNSELIKENIKDKKSILDIRATIDNKIKIDIEIQLTRTIYMPARSLYYWSKIYCDELEIGQKYNKLRKTVCINILDFSILPSKKYHSIFKIKEDEENYILTDLLEIHFLEMNKLKGYDNKDNLSKWISFIKADSKEELEKVADENSKINKAYTLLSNMSQDKKTRMEYLAREMALHDEVTKIGEAMEEGYEKGMQKGIEEGIEKGIEKSIEKGIQKGLQEGQYKKGIEIAKNLLDVLDDETIAKKTELSIEVIRELRKEK